eukprot:gene22531-biopygen4244
MMLGERGARHTTWGDLSRKREPTDPPVVVMGSAEDALPACQSMQCRACLVDCWRPALRYFAERDCANCSCPGAANARRRDPLPQRGCAH